MSALPQRALTNQETLRGTILGIRFYNPRNGWAVLSLHTSDEAVTAVGPVVNPREGDEYELTGAYVTDPKYGRQFKIQGAEVLLPSTRKGIIRYLASIAYGVGEVKAARIVGALGDDCLDKLQANPACLDGLTFLTQDQREQIKAHLREHSAVAEVSSLICKEGITPNLAAKVVAVFGADAVQIVKEEPYRLTEIDGIGFLTADKVAMSVGIKPDAPQRIQAAVLHLLSEAENDGHCYLRPSSLVKQAPDLLGHQVDTAAIAEAVATLIRSGLLTREEDDIYTSEMYEAETGVAQMVRNLVAQKPWPIASLDNLIHACETDAGLTYHPIQRQAIRMALTSGLSVLSGGPGTGKTLITKAIVAIYRQEHPNLPVHLCSPTGRAAKRLSEATGHPAKTIHRLLGYTPGVGFSYHEEEPLDGGLLIADEASMMDIRLAKSLFSACANGMQVVLVGDVDQLPSVGPGSVLRDIIRSESAPVTMLEYVYRQEEGSGISALADMVNQGSLTGIGVVSDVVSAPISNPDEALPLVTQFAKQAYAEYGLLGFTVLAPGHKGSAGVKALNTAIRAAINPGAGNSPKFAAGDRVMVTKNNYPHDVFNGDVGVVRNANPDGSIEVDFGDAWVTFGLSDAQAPLDILQMAFASTIHKSQGGEYPAVVVVLTRQHWIMLRRQLLYTAITRAKKRLIVIHQTGAFERAVRNNQEAKRNSKLAERLGGNASE